MISRGAIRSGLVALGLLLAGQAFAQSAVILPNARTQFSDSNGAPLVAGSVGFYIPTTLTPKTTWQDPNQSTPNANPVALDSSGTALIYGSGQYREILKDFNGTTIWDGLTQGVGPFPVWGGTSTGTPNAQIVAAGNWVQQAGEQLAFRAGFTNTTSMTLQIGATTYSLSKTGNSGPTGLTGGEIVAGNIYTVTYDSTLGGLQVANQAITGGFGASTNIASNSTTDLGSVTSHNANITGTTGISSFGSSAVVGFPIYSISFAGALTLTYNATSMILPGAANIVTSAGDSAQAQYLGSGNWQIVDYTRVAAAPLQPNSGIAGGFRNLKLTATASTVATITADGATLYDSSGAPAYVSGVSLTNTNSGNGANGLDTGSIATSTWYYAFIIYNPTSKTTASLISLSSSAPTLPSGYTFALRVGALMNASSGGYWRTIQYGRRATIVIGTNPTATPILVSGVVGTGSQTSPVYATRTLGSFVPPTASAVSAILSTNYQGGSSATVLVAPNAAYGGTNNGPTGSNGITPPLFAALTSSALTITGLIVLQTQALFVASSASGGAVAIDGWEDNL